MHMQVALLIHLIHFHIDVLARAREECHPFLDYPSCNPPQTAQAPHQIVVCLRLILLVFVSKCMPGVFKVYAHCLKVYQVAQPIRESRNFFIASQKSPQTRAESITGQ